MKLAKWSDAGALTSAGTAAASFQHGSVCQRTS